MPLENDNVKGPTWNEARSTDPIERMHLATMRRSRFPQPGRPSVGMPSYPGIRLALPRRREIFRRIADIGPDPRRLPPPCGGRDVEGERALFHWHSRALAHSRGNHKQVRTTLARAGGMAGRIAQWSFRGAARR